MKLVPSIGTAVVVAAALAVGGGAVWASPAIVKYSGTVKVSSESFTSGRCTDADHPHANLCPSGDLALCFCTTFTGSYSGPAGKGTASGVGTVDEGDGAAPAADGTTGCSPLYSVIRITGSKDDETFTCSGGSCEDLDSTASNAATCVLKSSKLFTQGSIVTTTGSFAADGKSGKVSMTGQAEK
jgi:hypothetical protein